MAGGVADGDGADRSPTVRENSLVWGLGAETNGRPNIVMIDAAVRIYAGTVLRGWPPESRTYWIWESKSYSTILARHMGKDAVHRESRSRRRSSRR
jgi:hypothetical protein